MKKQPLVSVLMRTYNRADYLAEAINSVINQTYSNWELLIGDDGSTDSTERLVTYFLKKDPRIKYFKKDHTGIADTGNFLADLANGDILCQADADDIQLPDKIDIVLEGLDDPEIDFTYSGYYHANPKGEIWQYIPPKPMTIENIKRNEVGAGESIAYRHHVWEKTPYRQEMVINDDAAFWVDLYKAHYRYSIVDKPSFKYRMLADGTSYAKKDEVDQLTLEVYKELDGSTEGVKLK